MGSLFALRSATAWLANAGRAAFSAPKFVTTADRVQTEGNATAYGRRADSGSMVTFSFCPVCGTTLFWELEGQPGVIAVALGTFAEPGFGEPRFSVYEFRRHPWVEISAPVEKN